ncbi:MAG: hypothetical protein PHU65_07380, partial [Actinomycetota bacterium]|nr:hypothetical protein [Actinomycetota bacterium]
LVGGACVSIYSDNNYLSYDIDFITTSSIKTMIPVLEQLGFKKATDNKSPGYLLKYGCCNKKLEKYYDEIELEINPINGSIKDWQEILLPLLQIKS